ncbi:aspartate racemase [Geomonas limicola]|uniref:Aspartate racemase n=1 Tax=Geomonas limicola TaxID=2740186 RepID=A0A6V8N8C0_9BACT|nr:aspartate/glutamate racemase family protein [Geomonas limicola]GFO68751.1 aspartate racemase [Geomonas limicola]
MKTVGLIGGMSWESTIPYYRHLNKAAKQRLGGLHSAKVLLYSVDFAEIEVLQREGDWDGAGRLLVEAALKLEAAGADCVAICTNTMHKVAPALESALKVPLLHIADAAGQAVRTAGLDRVGLLGTSFTMEQDFYKGRLAERFGIEVLVPEPEDRELVHRVIYGELCLGEIRDASRLAFQRIVEALAARGAQGVVLGCTEIPLLLEPADSALPLFDTTALHAGQLADWALA